MADDASVMKAIVFIVAFSAVFSFMYAYAGAAFGPSSDPQEDDFLARNFSPEELATMTFWENAEGSGSYFHSITGATTWGTYVKETFGTSENPCDGSRYDFYHPSNGQRVKFYPISGNTDFEKDDINLVDAAEGFLVYQSWGWWDQEWEWISFERVMMNFKITNENSVSNVHIDLKGGMNVYFIFSVGTTSYGAKTALDEGEGFQISIAQSIIDETNSASNAWNALSGLLTFSIDTGFWILDYLISIPIYASIAFIAFYIIKELIP